MDICRFAAALIKKIEGSHPSARLASEAAFERRHVIGPAWELSRTHPEIRVFTHPENRRATYSFEYRISCLSSRVNIPRLMEMKASVARIGSLDALRARWSVYSKISSAAE